jgi:PAS domain S-box-containing protein
MVVTFDPHTQQRSFVSPASLRLYGYDPYDAVDMPITEIIHPDDLPRVNDVVRSVNFGEQKRITYRGRCKNGEYIWVEASLTLVMSLETGRTEIVSVVRDVTDRIRYEAALCEAKAQAEAANRAKSAFISVMSHELRTPLNAVIGFADLMLNEVPGPLIDERHRSYVSNIHDSGIHLLKIINDMLDLSKAEAGKLVLNEEVFDVAASVRRAVRFIKPQSDKAGVSITADLPANFLLLQGDENKVDQVLLNLLSNAVKFTPRGGQISVTTRSGVQSGLSITVSDDGLGIAPDDVNRVFEPFAQIDSSLSRQQEGTGLGLPIVKAMIELHQGTVELNSTLGQGTDVTITFPPTRLTRSDKLEAV